MSFRRCWRHDLVARDEGEAGTLSRSRDPARGVRSARRVSIRAMSRAGSFGLVVATTTFGALAAAASAPAAGTGALAYTAYSGKGGAIGVTGTGGARARTLTPSSLASSDAAWSPDGRSIAFSASSGPTANIDIHVMAADGSARRRLTTSVEADSDPTWSPNGDNACVDRRHPRRPVRSRDHAAHHRSLRRPSHAAARAPTPSTPAPAARRRAGHRRTRSQRAWPPPRSPAAVR